MKISDLLICLLGAEKEGALDFNGFELQQLNISSANSGLGEYATALYQRASSGNLLCIDLLQYKNAEIFISWGAKNNPALLPQIKTTPNLVPFTTEISDVYTRLSQVHALMDSFVINNEGCTKQDLLRHVIEKGYNVDMACLGLLSFLDACTWIKKEDNEFVRFYSR